MASPTKVYPRDGFYVAGVPHAVHEFPTKAAAEEFAGANPQAFSLEAKEGMADAVDASPDHLPTLPSATLDGAGANPTPAAAGTSGAAAAAAPSASNAAEGA